MKIVESAIARYTLRDDGIVVARAINPKAPRNRESTAATLDVLGGLIGEEPKPVLWDHRATPRLEPEAWVQVIGRVGKMLVALAIVTDEGSSPKLGTYPNAIGALLVPTREFTDQDQAIAWLRQFQD